MISEIRNYFRQVIKDVDSDYKEHKEPIDVENIPDNNLEYTYSLRIGDLSSQRLDSTISGIFSVEVDIFKNGYQDQIDNYDKAYCTAIGIQALAMYQPRLAQTEALKSVESTGINIESINTNDNLYKFTIQFDVNVGYKYSI